MRKALLRSLVVSLACVFALAPAAVFAENGSDSTNTTTTTTSTENENETTTETQHQKSAAELKDKLQALKDERKKLIETKLDDAKEKVCENRKDSIDHIMDRGSSRAEKQLQLFSAITQRVQDFYTKKNLTVADYNNLVSAIDAAKAKTTADVATLKMQAVFDCKSSDPKGQVEAFKAALQTVNQDLKAYRTAVKNLIVAVKTAVGSSTTTTTTQENQ